MRFAALFLLGPLLFASAEHTSSRTQRHRPAGPVSAAKDAKTIAERETGGIAISARRIQLNGASGGWEVDVHMPKEDRGGRCIVDCDTRAVHTKDRIPNPQPNKQSKH